LLRHNPQRILQLSLTSMKLALDCSTANLQHRIAAHCRRTLRSQHNVCLS
jgi:hypothetical protein